MKQPKYVVDLSEEERAQLESMLRKGKSSARKQTRARILLKANTGMRSQDIGKALDVSAEMVYRARQRFVEEGMEAALNDKPRPGQKPKLDDKQCAHLIAIACSNAPDGHDHWTLRLLADKVVELGFAETFSYEGVRGVLKKLSQAVATRAMVHPGGKCRFRGGDGGRAGFVRRAV
jgi:transposase